MKHTHRILSAFFPLFLICTLLCTAGAKGITVDQTATFTFSADDFTFQDTDEGIFVTSVPNPSIATVYYGSRVLKAGDALPKTALDQLTLQVDCVTEQETTLDYCTISSGKVSTPKSLNLSILPKKNEPPVAATGSLETYKNIANQGQLSASDPENDPMTYQLEEAPKHGSVDLQETGTYVYTPDHNKVGKDSFTFTVTDSAGNTSEPAKITIQIKKPSEKAMYHDMAQDPDAFEAMWLKEQGIFTGSTIGGNFCFSPDKSVSRGEFLVMVMNLVDAKADRTAMHSGFADEHNTPDWMQPYIVSAWSNGMISGITSDDGVVFQATMDMTAAEAAVMLQNILQVPYSDAQAVFSQTEETVIPVWASEATAALSQAGVEIEITNETDLLTRREAANILYAVHQIMETNNHSEFYWVQ